MNRLDIIKERYETKFEDENFRRIDIVILLDEIHERDMLIDDFREQITNLKKQIKE